MSPLVPPPPHWERIPVRGETQVLTAWADPISYLGSKVMFPARMGMDREDVRADLQLTLLLATRKHYWTPGGKPPGALLRYILDARVKNLNRTTRVWFRSHDLMPEPPDDVTGAEPATERIVDPTDIQELIEDAEVAAICARLGELIGDKLGTEDYALLYLRHAMELTPMQIHYAIGVDNQDQRLRRRLARSKAAARSYLRKTLGVDSWETLVSTNLHKEEP